MSQASPAPPAIPDYELLRLVGRGGYGDVWLARGVTGVYRAIKIVWRDRFETADPYEREFRGLKQFAAISILESRQLALLHVGRLDDAGCFYYVMEPADDVETGRDIDPERYVPNTLKELRTRRGRLLAPDAIALGAELARALAGLHERGLVHRDIKPSNVILVGGAPKLADVGLVTTATEARTFVGTEGYVPPEGPGTPAADVYAMGRVLYEVATGRDGREFPTLPPNFHLLPDRRELLELNEVIVRACEPDAQRRHRDATAVLDDLLLLQAGKSVRRLRSTERHLARALRATVVLAIAAAVAGAGAWIAQQRADREMALRAQAEAERDAVRRRAEYSASLAQAQRALDHDELARARQLLQESLPRAGQADLRGFEWRALWREAQGDPHQVIRAAGPEVVALRLAPDESTVVAHDKSDTAVVYDAASLRETLRVHEMRRLAGFSADGAWLVGADATGATRRWSAKTGAAETGAHVMIGAPVATMGNDRVIGISDGALAELRVWDFAQRREALRLDLGPQNPAAPWMDYRSAASADGRIVVEVWVRGAGSAAQFRLTCVRLGDTPLVHHRETGRIVPAMAGVDARGPWVFFDANDQNPQGEIWRCADTGWEHTAETLPRDARKYVEFGDSGHPAAVIARVRQVAWLAEPRTDTNAIASAARGHNALISDLAVSARQQAIFSAATDGAVFRWPRVPPGPKRYLSWNSLGGTTNMVFTADSRQLWLPQDGRACVLLDAATLKENARAEEMVYPMAAIGEVLLGVGTKPGLLRVHARTGELLERVPVSDSPTRMAAATKDGRTFAVVDHAGNLFASGDPAPRLIRQGLQRAYLLALAPEGRRLWMVTSAPVRQLTCLSWPDGRELWQRPLPALASALRLPPDGRTLVLALENGFLEIRNGETGEVIKQIDSGSAAPQTLAFAPDGTRLFVGGIEGEVHCLNPESWQPIHTLPLGRDQHLHRMVSSPDGETLALLTRTGMLHLIRAGQ